MQRVVLFAVSCICLACSSDPDVKPVPQEEFDAHVDEMGQSGPRLKKRMMAAEDGSSAFVGWYDSEREENCAFRAGPDGKPRCMPTDLVHEIGGASGLDAAVYTDSNCKSAAYVSSIPRKGGCGQPVRYVYQSPEGTDTCMGDYYYVYEIGEESDLSASQLYVKYDYGCTVFNVDANVIVYTATEVQASEFVAAEETLQ